MRGVSKRIVRFVALAALTSTLVLQPVFAKPRTPDRGSYLEALIRKIVRVLDTIQIGLPPG
jgi:hypothetical protein